MGPVSAAILPLTAVLSVVVAVTRPLGADSVMVVVGLLAAAGLALTAIGVASARRRG